MPDRQSGTCGGALRRTAAILTLVLLASGVNAQRPQRPEARLKVDRAHPAGLATFVTADDGGAIPVEPAVAGRIQPSDFLHTHGRLFGVTDPAAQLVEARARVDRLGQVHTTYEQVHAGVKVFSGVLKVHQSADGAIRAANGRFYPLPDNLAAVPRLTAEEAADFARDDAGQPGATVEHSELVVVDPGWYGDPPIGPHLAYHIVLTDPNVPLREAFFVGAHKGNVLDRWSLLEHARDRQVIDGPSGLDVRTEGDPPTGVHDEDAAYDYSGDWYDYFDRGFGRDSYDDTGGTLISAVNFTSSFCPNAFWNGTLTAYCVGAVTDDVVAHEFGHALTQHTAGLVYQNQPGQLNESYSDVWGELVDLFNGNAAFVGPPGGTPWPADATYVGPGTDTPNDMRTGCIGGVSLDVNTPASIAGTYLAGEALFGAALTTGGTTGDVVVADPIRGCDADVPFSNAGAMSGKVVLIRRGDCAFSEKVNNAEDNGASAVIIANNVDGPPPTMSAGTGDVINIPSLSVLREDGDTIRSTVEGGSTVNVTLRANTGTGVRWLVSEDASAFGGAIRDMWQPSCGFDPDTANHPFQICHPNDNGGVHSGSGVPNHAFAMLVDGKTFNGFTVNPIGPIKAAAVWYRALTTYLTVASNFQDAYVALTQAASDLIDTSVIDPRDGTVAGTFTADDAAEVDKALQAVEMNTEGRCGGWQTVVDAGPAPICEGQAFIYTDDFESGVNGWTVFNSGPSGPPTPYNWVQVSGGLPNGRPGTVWFAEDRNVGDCNTTDESAVHSLRSPVIGLPTPLSVPTLSFTHFVEVETFYDGGNISISVNGGPFTQIPTRDILHNGYNNQLAFAPRNTNPLAGQFAWTGYNLVPGDFGTTVIDLSGFVSAGDDVQFQFDFGKDGCFGITGWFLDDFEVYECLGGDCNENGINDVQDIAELTSLDCDGNNVPDECQIDESSGAPGGPFFCDPASPPPPLAECDPDCNENAVPDGCELADNDCNANDAPDECDPDTNGNGTPDDCEFFVPDPLLEDPAGLGKNRAISVEGPSPSATAGGGLNAIRVRLTQLYDESACSPREPTRPDLSLFNDQIRWLGEPAAFPDEASPPMPDFVAAPLSCTPHFRDWSQTALAAEFPGADVSVLHAFGAAIVPCSTYELQTVDESCPDLTNPNCYSAALTVTTAAWGDTWSPFDLVNVTDITKLVDKFRGAPHVPGPPEEGAPPKVRAMLRGNVPPFDEKINVQDITKGIDAFRGLPYAEAGPTACP